MSTIWLLCCCVAVGGAWAMLHPIAGEKRALDKILQTYEELLNEVRRAPRDSNSRKDGSPPAGRFPR